MSLNEVVSAMIEHNEKVKDPLMGKLINALSIVEAVDWSYMVYPNHRLTCHPPANRRSWNRRFTAWVSRGSHPRLTKVVLPSKSHWLTALRNSHRLRNSDLSDIFVRRSMTPAERDREKKLRQECKARNDQLKSRVWVVYRGELWRSDEITKSQVTVSAQPSQGNAQPLQLLHNNGHKLLMKTEKLIHAHRLLVKYSQAIFYKHT
ncbi:hypothetical protein OSTOST_03733 [Ostertagia ostertagi]